MKIKYTLQVFFVTIFVLQSCSSSKAIISKQNEKHPILDSLGYVVYPDDDYLPKGNTYFQRLTSYGDTITPYLIEKIIDTTKTDLRIADYSNLCFWVFPLITGTFGSIIIE